jgi:hypothetical protein
MKFDTRLALRAALLTCAAFSLGACATVTRGSSQAWTVETTPGGAAVATTTGFKCDATPCTFKMKRKKEFDVTITKAGYKPYTTSITNQISGKGGAALAGNVLVGGLVGLGVDAATGASKDLTPNPLKVTLEPEAKVADAAPAVPATPAN